MGLEFHCIQVSSFQGVGIEEFHCTQVSSFHGVGVPLYTGVSFQGVGLEEFPCIQRSPHLKESAPNILMRVGIKKFQAQHMKSLQS